MFWDKHKLPKRLLPVSHVSPWVERIFEMECMEIVTHIIIHLTLEQSSSESSIRRMA